MPPLRIGLIGAGGISVAHARAAVAQADHARITAVCDVLESAAQRRAADVGATAVYTDARRMCAEADIDAVIIATVHATHAELAVIAAETGKHALVEKPMANSLADCRKMVDAADEAGVVLMVGQTRRYDPSYRGVVELVRSGELGPIRAVRMDAMQNGPEALTGNSWLLDGNLAGGGVVISVAIHQIDLARMCLGEVKRVTATCRTLHPAFRNGAEDYAAAVLEFESGAIGELFGTYAGFRQPWSETFMIFGDDGTIHSYPERGRYRGPALVASRVRSPKVEDFTGQFFGFEPVPPATDLRATQPFENQLLHFVDCCRSAKEPVSSGRDNLNTMKIVFGIYESSRRRAPVDLAELG